MSIDLADLRREYDRGALTLEALDPDPLRQFEAWFGEAMAAGEPEVNAMSLATAAGDGQPSLRTVLLKYLDARGFVFFTNLASRKAREIADNPRTALMFMWPGQGRQVVISGSAQRIAHAESLKYFLSRPRGSRLGAWVSHQSSVISSRALIEQKLDEMKRKFAGGEIPLPSFWGGYRVSPHEIEFWQGARNRLHDRFRYRHVDEAWTIERLAP